MTAPLLISVKAVAEMLSVSENTVWRRARDTKGFPQPEKLAGCTRWRYADLERYVSELSGVPTGGPEKGRKKQTV